MNISITVPDDVGGKLALQWKDLPRRALEALVADGYREGLLTSAHVQQALGIASRFELDTFLKREAAYLDYSLEDLESDRKTLRHLPRP